MPCHLTIIWKGIYKMDLYFASGVGFHVDWMLGISVQYPSVLNMVKLCPGGLEYLKVWCPWLFGGGGMFCFLC